MQGFDNVGAETIYHLWRNGFPVDQEESVYIRQANGFSTNAPETSSVYILLRQSLSHNSDSTILRAKSSDLEPFLFSFLFK